jgi:anaerobic selenocysteine-containing dehydrogenase
LIDANGSADHRAFYAWVLRRHPEAIGIDMERLQEVSVPIFPSHGQRKSAGLQTPAWGASSGIGSETPSDVARRFPLAFQSTRTIAGHGDAGRWWSWLRELEAENVVQVHPDIAAALGIENGDDIRVAGAEDGCRATAWISRMVNRQTVWSPRRLRADRVLIHKRGQSPEEAHRILKAIL